MVQFINFENTEGEDTQLFRIELDSKGRLNFIANDNNNNLRMSIDDTTGQLVVGGGGEQGVLQLQDGKGANTIFLGASATGGPGTTGEANLLLGGGKGPSGLNGNVRLGRFNGPTTVDIQGFSGDLFLGANPADGAPGQAGDVFVRNGHGKDSIRLRGNVGEILCDHLTETSDVRLKENVVPLSNALDTVMALRGVHYQRVSGDTPGRGTERPQIGFIGQEMEAVCPELVSTGADGYLTLNYSRVTTILVEAVKEQQQQLERQSSALAEALEKIDRIAHPDKDVAP